MPGMSRYDFVGLWEYDGVMHCAAKVHVSESIKLSPENQP